MNNKFPLRQCKQKIELCMIVERWCSEYLAAVEGAGLHTGDSVQDVLYGRRQPG